MVTISKPQVVMFTILLILVFPVITVHGLYVVTLPSNTIYADDFENYSNGMQLGSYGCQSGSGCFGGDGGNGGWGYFDTCPGGHGGNANITATNFFSPSHSIATWSCTSATDLFDLHRIIPLPTNSTSQISMSIWFALNRSYTNQQDNNAHISIETWNGTARFEAPLFLYSKINPINNGCTSIRGIAPDFFIADTANTAGSDHYTGLCLHTWGQISGSNGAWHHYTLTVNILSKTLLSATLDGYDLTSIVKGKFFSVHSGSDTAFQSFNPKDFIRFEIGAGNGATHVSPTDNWVAWHDDLIITDVTLGQPSIIQFGLIAFSAWYPVLIAAIGVLYGTSGIGLMRRVILGKTEGMLSNYKMIFITGLVASIGFILILVVGSFATQQVCQNTNGAVCKY